MMRPSDHRLTQTHRRRMQFHGRELKQASERLQRFESFQKAKDNLKAFQAASPVKSLAAMETPKGMACLEHLHGHAERAPFRRWKAMSKYLGERFRPAEDQQLSEQLPLALVMAVVVDAAVDGMLIGPSVVEQLLAAAQRVNISKNPSAMPAMSKISSAGLAASALNLGRMAASAFVAPSAEPTTQRRDPIGYCGGDCTKEDFDRRRAVELKHGRICMFAAIGMLWPDVFGKFDGYLSPSQSLKFADVPSGLAAISKVPLEGWLQVLLVAGLIETQLFKDQSFGGFAYAKYGEPGNFGTGYWGRKIQDPAERRAKLTTELNNGRLAMISVTGMLIQNGLTGQSPVEQLTSGHISPFNDGQGFFAFDASKELGACPPLGYWDPFGMMAFQDEEKFRRNRELELKHGRICMVATIGMIVPDLFGRFGGDLSPSMGLKFSDIPCTIEAIYKVPAAGWLQVFALAGAIEAKNLAFPTNYGYPPFWGQIDKLEPEEKQKKLSPRSSSLEEVVAGRLELKRLAEINNGRLAMVAMAAIVAQNGATGQSLVEQFTTGNLNPFIGGYARADKVAMKVAADGFFSGKAMGHGLEDGMGI
ncbi:Fucoxanthin-chlorophyll a-c binding protein B [Durusdinium trenchii]|uniref:Chloroplastic n=1 Tax=Durusdinium trenchii TaxID=1381693 RepID=A0ABP0K129_9DINO